MGGSFYGGDNTNPLNGNTQAPSSFYPNGTQYATLANADTLTAEIDADLAAAQTAATNAANSLATFQASGGNALPLMDGASAIGTSNNWTRQDHIHPTDTSRASANFTQAGTGAVSRTVVSKLQETISVKDFGAVGNGSTDDTAAIQAALNYANTLGGAAVSLGTGRYLINSANLSIPAGVFLEGIWEHIGERINDDYTQLPCVLLLNPTHTVQITGRNAGVRGVAVINSALTTPTTLRNVLDGVNSFSGTGVTVGNGTQDTAADCYLGHLFVMGFAQGIHINGAQSRIRAEYIAMDNTAGYLSDGCPDVGGITQMRCWPYFASHLSVTQQFAVSNAVNNGSGLIRITCASNTFVTGDSVVISGVTGTTEANGRWTVTVINSTTLDLQGSTFTHAYVSGGNVYARLCWARNGAAYDFKGIGAGFNALYNLGSYGYDVGIKIESADDYDNLIGCWNDNNLSANDPTTVGVWILNSGAVTISGHTCSSQGTALKVDVSGRSVNRAFISNSRIFGTSLYTAQIINGAAHFTNCTFGTAPIRSESTAGQSMFVNCDLSVAQFSYGSQATPRAYIADCVTAGNVGQFQPTGQTDQASTVIAKWSGPGRATPANNDNIVQSYFMMNSAGNMIEVQRDHHRIDNATAGSESGEYYLSLASGGVLGDYYSWTPTVFTPLAGGINLGSGGANNSWGSIFHGSGKQINWNNGDTVITHSTNQLALSGSANTNFSATGNLLSSGTTAPTLTAGQTILGGTFGAGLTLVNGSGAIYNGTSPGLVLQGRGAGNDIALRNNAGANALSIPTGTQNVNFSGYVLSTSPSGGVGYETGAGGTVAQATSRTAGVTLNTVTGAITMFSAAGSATAATFTVTNSSVAATDVIALSQKSGTNLYSFLVTAVAAGSFNITFYTTGGTATDAPVISFAVIKGATA
jgi:hypothetical protein